MGARVSGTEVLPLLHAIQLAISLAFVLRTAGDPLGYAGTARAALRAVVDDPLVAAIQSLEQGSGSRPIGGEAEPVPPFPLVTAPVSMGIE